MASRSLGTLTLDIVAKIGGLTAGMSQAEREVEKRTRAIRRNMERLRTAFSWLTAGAGIAGIGAAIKNSIQVGDELEKAAVKAGISGRAMSQLSYAAKTVDVELGSLSNSLRFMQTNISQVETGSKSAQLAFAALGLEVKSLKGLGADEQFEIIADRINKLARAEDKARAATELFGRSGAELLPLFAQGAQGIRNAREEADRLGITLGDEQIKKLSDSDAAVKRLQGSWEGFRNKMVSEIAPGIAFALDLASGKVFDNDSPEAKLRALQADLSFFEKNREVFRARGDEAAVARISERIRSLEMDIYSLQTINDDFAARRLRAISGPTGTPPGYEAAQESEETLTAIIVENAKIRIDAMEAYYQAIDDRTKTSMERQISDLNEIQSMLDDQFKAGRISADVYNERWTEALASVIEEVEVTSKRIGEVAEKPFDLIEEYAKQAARNIQDTFADFLFDPFKDGLKGMLVGFINTLRRMVAEAAAAKILGGINLAGGIGSAVGNLLGFAGGGRPPVGVPSIVGERGPELFIPDQSGTIVPNHKLGGNITINVDARGAQQGVAQQLAAVLPAVVREAVNQSRAAVMSDFDRRGLRFA